MPTLQEIAIERFNDKILGSLKELTESPELDQYTLFHVVMETLTQFISQAIFTSIQGSKERYQIARTCFKEVVNRIQQQENSTKN